MRYNFKKFILFVIANFLSFHSIIKADSSCDDKVIFQDLQKISKKLDKKYTELGKEQGDAIKKYKNIQCLSVFLGVVSCIVSYLAIPQLMDIVYPSMNAICHMVISFLGIFAATYGGYTFSKKALFHYSGLNGKAKYIEWYLASKKIVSNIANEANTK